VTNPKRRKRQPAAEHFTLADDVGELWRRIVLEQELDTPAGRLLLGTALRVAHAVFAADVRGGGALYDLDQAMHGIPNFTGLPYSPWRLRRAVAPAK
jgi:hypothetical protein